MNNAAWARDGVLVLGARGMLGGDLIAALRRRLSAGDRERLVGWDIDELDIQSGDRVSEALHRLRPSTVINAAAHTDVDGCEDHVDEAMAVNATAASTIGRACAAINAISVYMGTDYIFDGAARRPYRPDDGAKPLSVYGRSKWEGEEAVRGSGCEHLIVRTSWLFGPHGRNFVEAILGKARSGGPLNVVDDQVGRPTLASDLADAIVRLLDVEARGTVHFANAGACSWFEFAQEIVRQAGCDVAVSPMSSTDLGRPARRPAYSVLDTSKYTELTGQEPQEWKGALGRYLATKTRVLEL